MKFKQAFSKIKPLIIGMIHVPALPGTPRSCMSMVEILRNVRKEAEMFAKVKVDGLIVENMNDIPYVKSKIGPEVISAMSLACNEVSTALGESRKEMILGVQILAAHNEEALAVAHCTGFDFIRAECFVFSHVADEGWMDGCAGDLLRYRKSLGAEDVAVITDVKKKHSAHVVTSDVSIGEMAKAAEFFMADGVVVTGTATGAETDTGEIREVVDSTSLPVLVGSGVTTGNLDQYRHVPGLIVGSEFKVDGKWWNTIDQTRLQRFMDKAKNLRK